MNSGPSGPSRILKLLRGIERRFPTDIWEEVREITWTTWTDINSSLCELGVNRILDPVKGLTPRGSRNTVHVRVILIVITLRESPLKYRPTYPDIQRKNHVSTIESPALVSCKRLYWILVFLRKPKPCWGLQPPTRNVSGRSFPASVPETECSLIVAHFMCSNPNSRQSGHNTSSYLQGRVFA